MIPNGKEMDWNGHHLVFESTTYECRGCFFENMGSCPDCDEGIWVEENPSPWHTGTPTEEGWYLLAVKHGEKIHYNANRLYSGGEWFYSKLGEVLAYQKIEPYEASKERNK